MSGGDWRAALAAGRFDEAQRLYLLADGPDADTRQALGALADVAGLVREKSWKRARRRLERLETRPPLVDWLELEDELAWLQEVSNSLDELEFEEALRRLEGGAPRWFEAEAANQRGTALVHAGALEDARRAFDHAVQRDPRHYRALTNLGNAKLESGKVDEAIDCYQRAIAVNDEFANAHHNLGVAYRRQGKVARSVHELRRAQRVQQRTERERTREQLGEGAGASVAKGLRWMLYGLAALALFVVLRNQGLF